MDQLSNNTKIELHYFFNDESHSMDAGIRLKCETELLSLVREIANYLEVEISIETEGHHEGGLREVWNIIGENHKQLSVVLLFLTLIYQVIPIDQTTKRLERKKIELEIKKLEKELGIESDPTAIKNEGIDSKNSKILKHRSSFFQTLLTYPKVTEITSSALDKNNKPIGKPKKITRSQFSDFVIEEQVLTEVDDKATITLISVVLVKGKHKWKGYYNNEPIDFYMQDSSFKNAIFERAVEFKSGSYFECTLEISKKIDEFGNEKRSYSVTQIIEYKQDGLKFHAKNKPSKSLKNQLSMFKNEN